MRRHAWIVVVAMAASPIGPSAQPRVQPGVQTPGQTPVFRGSTVLVPVTVTVLGKDDRPVTDLTQADFTVLEDGKPQPIRSFAADRIEAAPAGSVRVGSLVRGAPVDPLAPRARRTFVIMLGYGRIQVPTRAIDGALHFVRERLLPQDVVAVLGFDRATDLTTDHDAVAGVLERYKAAHEEIIHEIADYYTGPFHIREDLPASIQDKIDAIFAPYRRSAVDLLFGTAEFQKRDASPVSVPWRRTLLNDLWRTYAAIEYLRPIDGEKHLIALSNRLLPPPFLRRPGQDDLSLAKRANAARIVLDIVGTAGAPQFSMRGGVMPDVDQIDEHEHLADLTGGQFTGLSYASEVFDRIDDATRVEYLIGYTPADQARDDRFRKIEVKVDRPGVTVLYGHGYTPKPPAALDVRAEMAAQRLAEGAGSDGDLPNIRVQARVSAETRAGPSGRLRVDVTIDASTLSFLHANGRYRGTVDLEIVCGDEHKQIVGRADAVANPNVDEATYQRYLKSGIADTLEVALSGPAKFVKVIVYDYGADQLGTATVVVR